MNYDARKLLAEPRNTLFINADTGIIYSVREIVEMIEEKKMNAEQIDNLLVRFVRHDSEIRSE